MQIRNKLTLQFLVILAGILLIAMWYIYFQFKNHLENEFYNNLRSKALMTAEMVVGKTSLIRDEFALAVKKTSIHATDYTENIAIYDRNNQLIYSFNPVSRPLDQRILAETWEKQEFRFERGKFCALGLVYTRQPGQAYLVIAESVFEPGHLKNLARILLWVFCISMALVALGGWFFAGQALAPLNRIMNQVDAVLPTDLSRRLESPNQKDELSRLVITFNKLLDRIQNAFSNQKMFLSNISHEFKNPLNVIIAQLEVTLAQKRPATEYRQTLVSVLEDAKYLNDVTEKLTQLAKINSDNLAISFERIRLDELIWQAKAAILKAHPEQEVRFEVQNLPEEESKLYVSGNEQLLKTALINLVENGCKFSPEKRVHIRLSSGSNGTLTIELQDFGPGIEPEEIPHIFEPFYRSPNSAAVKGSGIGLSLVNSILKLHRIELQLVSVPGVGSTFTLLFPPASVESDPHPFP